MHGDWQRGGDVAGLSSRAEGGSHGVSNGTGTENATLLTRTWDRSTRARVAKLLPDDDHDVENPNLPQV